MSAASLPLSKSPRNLPRIMHSLETVKRVSTEKCSSMLTHYILLEAWCMTFMGSLSQAFALSQSGSPRGTKPSVGLFQGQESLYQDNDRKQTLRTHIAFRFSLPPFLGHRSSNLYNGWLEKRWQTIFWVSYLSLSRITSIFLKAPQIFNLVSTYWFWYWAGLGSGSSTIAGLFVMAPKWKYRNSH